MTEKHYNWIIGGPLPLLNRHSAVKHALLHDYLVNYFLTLVSDPRQDHLKLTIVDGFCGGGRYIDEDNKEVPGSPIIILNAVQEAKARIFHTQKRIKPLNIDAELICIDQDKRAIKHLKWVFEQEGYGEEVNSGQIKLVHGQFEEHAKPVINRAVDRSRLSGKAIFVLDQYGYINVPLPTLKEIFNRLKKAEVILTFNVDSLINYLNKENLSNFESKVGIDDALTASDIDNLVKGPYWRRSIQSKLYSKVTSGSGARYFTPFFIRPAKGHGDFWLLHLSQHSKARDVMAATHWKHNNYFVHYGHAGLDMFGVGYAAAIDEEGSPQTAFEFDDLAATQSHFSMLEEIPILLEKKREGIQFKDFFAKNCNKTPATRSMIESATLSLVQRKQVEVAGPDGKKRNIRTAFQKPMPRHPVMQQAFPYPQFPSDHRHGVACQHPLHGLGLELRRELPPRLLCT